MKINVRDDELAPRVLLAIAAGALAAFMPGLVRKSLLLGGAAALLTTAATGYCPVNAARDGSGVDVPHWRTIKTYRVEG
jgi:hypothetical protein